MKVEYSAVYEYNGPQYSRLKGEHLELLYLKVDNNDQSTQKLKRTPLLADGFRYASCKIDCQDKVP